MSSPPPVHAFFQGAADKLLQTKLPFLTGGEGGRLKLTSLIEETGFSDIRAQHQACYPLPTRRLKLTLLCYVDVKEMIDRAWAAQNRQYIHTSPSAIQKHHWGLCNIDGNRIVAGSRCEFPWRLPFQGYCAHCREGEGEEVLLLLWQNLLELSLLHSPQRCRW